MVAAGAEQRWARQWSWGEGERRTGVLTGVCRDGAAGLTKVGEVRRGRGRGGGSPARRSGEAALGRRGGGAMARDGSGRRLPRTLQTPYEPPFFSSASPRTRSAAPSRRPRRRARTRGTRAVAGSLLMTAPVAAPPASSSLPLSVVRSVASTGLPNGTTATAPPSPSSRSLARPWSRARADRSCGCPSPPPCVPARLAAASSPGCAQRSLPAPVRAAPLRRRLRLPRAPPRPRPAPAMATPWPPASPVPVPSRVCLHLGVRPFGSCVAPATTSDQTR